MLEQEYQKEHGTGPFACYYSGYSNSTLATYVKMSPNKTSPRPNTLTRITPIVTGETFTAYALGETFYSGGGSGNYGIGTDGTIGLYVNEQDRAWSTGGGGINDNRTVTVFCSSDTNAEIYADTYNSMVELAADILVRYCKDTLIWFGDKDATLAYEATIADNEMLLTYSEWFRN
jgi:N-acetyl-anhydromuramyl-L-alanine amidase AmpD